MATTLLGTLAVSARAAEPDYKPADEGQRPRKEGVLPNQFLRGFDPITVYFSGNEGPGRGPADNGQRPLKITPAWPGAYTWLDRKTLQFRPAEPWPALARFAVETSAGNKVLSTMMAAPSAMSPSSGSDQLRPFRTLSLTFPQPLPLEALREMLRLELRDLPGLSDAASRAVTHFGLALLPRGNQKDKAVYALTLDEDIPEGKQLQIQVSLALGDEGKVLWTGRLSTRQPFHLELVSCGSASRHLVEAEKLPREMALSCGNGGELPALAFSAPVLNLTLTELKKLVRLEPSVPDLHFETSGERVLLRGKFVPDTLYRVALGAADIHDDSGRSLVDPGPVELFFYRGWRKAFLRFGESNGLLEANGPRMLPLIGYGDARADVRVYRVDPLNNGLWPFPDSPVTVEEETAPPFPGEEPATRPSPVSGQPDGDLVQHLRLLGSPLVSKVVDLPLAHHSGTTRFGLDLGALIDPVVGEHRPGTYVVGVRRLTGPPERSYVRVQLTNLALTTVEDHAEAVFYVRTLDKAEGVSGAKITLEGQKKRPRFNQPDEIIDARVVLDTESDGLARLPLLQNWVAIQRITVSHGEDLLVIDPQRAPPRFVNNHWGASSQWLSWLMQTPPPRANEKTLAYLFSERPIYRPGETVYLKGFVREKVGGELEAAATKNYAIKVDGPNEQSWVLPTEVSALDGFAAQFKEKDPPTGEYRATLFEKKSQTSVATWTFQIEAYRLPTFEVQLAGAATVRLDQPFKEKAVARYYAGGSVANQSISWKVTQRPTYYVPEGYKDFIFASSDQFARPGASKAPESITRDASLDDNGADQIEVNPALDIDGSARIYHFEATVTGTDNQQVSAVTEVRALPAFVLGLKLQRYSEKLVDLKPQILAIGVDGRPLADQSVQLRLFRRVWHSHLRETNFATGQAQYVTEQEDIKVAEQTLRTGTSAVTATLPLKEAGVYVVELTSRDKLGRVQTLSADVYMGGSAPMVWQKAREGVFTITPDKKSYQPGQTAHLILQSPFQTARALVIVELPKGNEYLWKDVSGGKAVVDLPIEAKDVPNIPVHVALMRGRIGKSGDDDTRFRPQTEAATVEVEVEPVKNELRVHVDHPETARPGTKVDFTIHLKDDLGKPVGGEVTLWLVDEAVLSLAREQKLEPLPHFIDRNAPGVSLRDTRNWVVGRLFEAEDEPGGDGEGGEGEGNSGTRLVRKSFKTVPYYQATLQVPASGKLVVPIALSDDLTNFKVRAMAVSGFSRFGYEQTVLRVRLPVLAQPQLPRFVRQNDEFWGGAVARLVEGAEGPGAVDIQVVGALGAASNHKTIDLTLAHAQSVVVPITAQSADPGAPSEIQIRVDVSRKSDGAGDAVKSIIPVLPDRQVEKFVYFDRVKPGPVKLQPFPEQPHPGTAHQEVVFSSVPGVLEVAAALDYLEAYPHGCLEQKMSQLGPAIEEAALLKKLKVNPGYASQAGANVRRLIDEMPAYQGDEGLFGYWPGSGGDVALTAQALDFLHAAQRMGVSVEPKLIARATEALKRVLRSDYAGYLPLYRYNQQTEALRALAETGAFDEHYAMALFEERVRLDATSLSDLALAMRSRNALFKTNLDQIRSDLWDGVIIKLARGNPVFQGLKRPGTWGGYYLGSDASSVAAVLEALVTLDPSNKQLPLLLDGLLSSARGSRGFGSNSRQPPRHPGHRGLSRPRRAAGREGDALDFRARRHQDRQRHEGGSGRVRRGRAAVGAALWRGGRAAGELPVSAGDSGRPRAGEDRGLRGLAQLDLDPLRWYRRGRAARRARRDALGGGGRHPRAPRPARDQRGSSPRGLRGPVRGRLRAAEPGARECQLGREALAGGFAPTHLRPAARQRGPLLLQRSPARQLHLPLPDSRRHGGLVRAPAGQRGAHVPRGGSRSG